MTIESTIMAADSTVRSQDSNNSSDSKDTKVSKMTDSTRASSSKDSSKPESCLESKHSKEALIDTRNGSGNNHGTLHHHHRHQTHRERSPSQARDKQEPKDDSSELMFTSCGQLLLGIVLVVFGVLVLVHGAALSGSGAGLWAGTAALVAGALGVVATLATGSRGFSSAHLASSLVALALANMAAITALTAVVRDAQRPAPDVTLLTFPNNQEIDVQEGWAGLLASIGLLVAAVVELFVAGYTCLTLAPKLCGCLRPDVDDDTEEIPTTMVDGKTLKTRNMVHQWVIAQNHVSKNQPIYVVQPVVPVHPMMQPPYGMPPPPPPGKFASGFLPMQMLPAPPPGHHHHHMVYQAPPPPSSRPSSQIARGKQQQHPKKRRHSSDQSDGESRQHRRSHHHQQQVPKIATTAAAAATTTTISDEQLARTYTGLDKRISEEFISIAMDPERKSKASSHHGSEINAANK